MAHRVAARAEADLDDIWEYVAKESGGMEIANRLIDSITDRFFLLSSFPQIGRARHEDFGLGSRSFAVGDYVIVYCLEAEDVLVLRVVHGRRDLETLFAIR
jgi:toxin ParE1/3/4